ncbi:alpha/beta hydrolase fold domain-containing protein [Roseovarius salis]|uniref:alpha/beta hydrolase n=1 Tax=Roseovarius salis TaxID=3376063 RepID=UPI0037CC6C2D
MSLARAILNPWLRLTEKPYLARVTAPETLRRNFEIKARLLFHAPPGTRRTRGRMAQVPVQWVTARGVARRTGPLILYFHGGGYVFGSSDTHRAMLGRLSRITGLPVCLPDYRLAPEHPFPAAVEDALAVWRELGKRPGGVILGGDSSGGGLALALLGEILRHDLPRPAGLFAFSPLTDLTLSGESLSRNAEADVMLPACRTREGAEIYLSGAAADDPRASPLFADFRGAPPVWLGVGDTEILLDDTRRMAARLGHDGVDVTEIVAHDLPHVWPFFQPYLPEANATLRQVGSWISRISPSRDGS